MPQERADRQPAATLTLALADTPEPRATARPRSVWLDRIRAGLIQLVILHHAAITCGASSDWFFAVTEATRLPLTFLVAVNQAFFMGLIFLISGALAPDALDRKGRLAFLKDRAIRRGLPVLVFGFVLGPLTVALSRAAPVAILDDATARVLGGSFALNPLWFPEALFLFSAVLVVWPTPKAAIRPVPPVARWMGFAQPAPRDAHRAERAARAARGPAGE